MAGERGDRFTEAEDRYAGYQVYDHRYEKIGKIDDLFLDEHDEPEYIGVKMGFLGTNSTLIPFEIVRINDVRGLAEVAADSETIKNGPNFEDDGEISPEFEEHVYRHYGLDLPGPAPEGDRRAAQDTGSGYGPYYAGSREEPDVDVEYGEREYPERAEYEERESAVTGGAVYDQEHQERETASDRDLSRETMGSGGRGDNRDSRDEVEARRETGDAGDGDAGPGITMGDRDESGGFHEHPPEDEGVGERESDVEDKDELRVGRTEEELTASRRERETGTVNVRKRVRTDRERMTVPKRREQVKVDRVPVESETTEAEIGEDEVSVPVTEEEVEVTKRPVQKEEIRVRKEAVEEEEVVEEDLRREEVEVEEESERDENR